VPLQRLPVRLADGVSRHPDALAVEGHVGLAVVEVVLEAAADEEAAVGGDGDVAGVEETVDVGAEEEAVVEAVLASLGHGTDVRGVQDREGLLSRDGAAAAIVVRHQDAEGPLAQPRTDEHRVAVDPGRFLRRDLRRHGSPLEAGGHLIPQMPPHGGLRVVALPLDDARGEVRWRRDPERLVEEERGPEQDAADRIVGAHRPVAVLLDPPPHLVQGRGAVLGAEGVPGEAPGRAACAPSRLGIGLVARPGVETPGFTPTPLRGLGILGSCRELVKRRGSHPRAREDPSRCWKAASRSPNSAL
jgi:hypothetical protein